MKGKSNVSLSQKKRGPVPGSPNANAGGQALKAKYGPEYFRAIGKKGGESRRDVGADYAELGRAGGKATNERHGKEHYQAIGRKGGSVRKSQ